MPITQMRKLYKDYIQEIAPYEQGKPIEEVKREFRLKRVIKLASNENPLGPSRMVIRALRRFLGRIHLYPDGGAYHLKRRLAEELGVKEKNLILGNGSNEIIEILLKGFIEPGDKVISSASSFLVYRLITQTMGGEFVEIPMQGFRYDLEAIAKTVDEKTKVIFIANPNNPTGTYVGQEETNAFIEKIPRDCLVVFDEAYTDFVEAEDFPDTIFYVKAERPNLVVLRTFSKSFGLAGLRIGYGVAAEGIIEYLNKIRQPFNVNSAAQCAALAALDDEKYLLKTKEVVAAGRKYFYKKLKRMKLNTIPSQANFVMVDAEYDSEVIFRALLREGVIVRRVHAYGFPTYLRVSVGRRKDNRRFIRALKRVLKKVRRGEV